MKEEKSKRSERKMGNGKEKKEHEWKEETWDGVKIKKVKKRGGEDKQKGRKEQKSRLKSGEEQNRGQGRKQD